MNEWIVPGYTEIRELGHGGSGRVMLAVHDETGTPVAIKYLAANLTGSDTFIDDFRGEAQILADLDSPYVTRLYEYLESEGRAAIVMELVDGVSMRAMIREQGAVEPEAALVVLKGSLRGLAAAHRRKVVHRDYKPANVLVDTDGQSKLADFGLAVRTGRQGILAGTPSYMAPEQWLGAKATPQTDIYAATATFFECLAGRPPFRAAGDRELLRLQHEQSPIPVELAPESVHGLLRHGLAKDPKDRPRDAAAFLRELETVASDNYGAEWEAEGRRKLARRVLMLAFLLPRALPSPTPVATSTSFALTKLGKSGLMLAALLIVLAGVIVGRVALADQGSVTVVSAAASVTLPPTVLVPVPPAPSPSPSTAATVSPPFPSPSGTKKPKKPHPSKSASASPSPSESTSSAPPPPPPPTFGVLVVGSKGWYTAPCGDGTCYYMPWVADTRVTGGEGAATLHVEYYAIPDSGAPPILTKEWDIAFNVTGAGPMSWNDFLPLATSCDDQQNIQIRATITVGGTTAITARTITESCLVLQ